MRGLQQTSPAVVKTGFDHRNLATIVQVFMLAAVRDISMKNCHANILKYDMAGCSLHYRSNIFYFLVYLPYLSS
jgi:hypothetical protein